MTTLPKLSKEQWDELVERLTLHAHCKLARLRWRGVPSSRGGAVPGGVEPADLAADAIVAVIQGIRNWNPDTDPDFLLFLKSVVDSMVSHLVECAENRLTRRFEGTDASDSPLPAYQLADKGPGPANVCADAEERERFRDLVIKELDGDPIAQGVFECMEAEIFKPADMAELLNKSVKEINNAQKRLKRKVEHALKTHKQR